MPPPPSTDPSQGKRSRSADDDSEVTPTKKPMKSKEEPKTPMRRSRCNAGKKAQGGSNANRSPSPRHSESSGPATGGGAVSA